MKNKALSFKKSTVANLNQSEMKNAAGGFLTRICTIETGIYTDTCIESKCMCISKPTLVDCHYSGNDDCFTFKGCNNLTL
ncbi:MAG: class I lanthipeptide [Hyphomicrobiales bacterium]